MGKSKRNLKEKHIKQLGEYVEILNKYGPDSKKERQFLKKVAKDKELVEMCDVVRAVRFGISSRLKVRNPELRRIAKKKYRPGGMKKRGK